MTMNIGQTALDSIVAIGESLVIEAEKVEDGGVEIERGGYVFYRFETKLIVAAVGYAWFDACAGKPAGEAIVFMERAVDEKKPFFLYLPINAAHGAVSVPKEFRGKSGVSSRADKVLWVNKSLGRINDSLASLGQTDNTLMVYTSDNGPFAARGDDMLEGHDASGPYRGYKTDAWDGGTRVPFIARWPGKIKPGTTNDSLVSLTDIMATISAVFDKPLPDWAGEDSFNQLPNLLGESNAGRDSMITQSYTGILSIRRDKWKLILDTKGSGGFYHYSPEVERHTTMSPWRPDMSDSGQLYDIDRDPYETMDVFDNYPEVVTELKTQLRAYINSGRTRPL